MQKFNDYNMNRHVNTNNNSMFFNDNCKRDINLLNYFETHFVSTHNFQKISSIRWSLPENIELFHEETFKAIEFMSNCIYDENNANIRQPISPYIGKDDEFNSTIKEYEGKVKENKKLYFLIISLKLARLIYINPLSSTVIGREADKRFIKLCYNIIEHLEMTDLVDECLKETLEKFEYDSNTEMATFLSIVDWGLYNCSDEDYLKKKISSSILRRTPFIDTDIKRTNDFELTTIRQFKDLMLQVTVSELNEDVKTKIKTSLNNIIEDCFKDKTLYDKVNSILAYGLSRPNDICDKLLEEFGEKYRYKGVVYHGFRNINTNHKTVEELLAEYTTGYISASKDIEIATEFMHQDDEEFRDSDIITGVIEIYVDENVDNVDVERLLTKGYEDYSYLYERLNKSFAREKEVLIKLPLLKYKFLRPEAVKAKIKSKHMTAKYEEDKKNERIAKESAKEAISNIPEVGAF